MIRSGFTLLAAGVAAMMLSACGQHTSTSSNASSDDLFQSHSITRFGIEGTHKIALTFDDGPGAGTGEILDTLKEYGIHATFFTLGKNDRVYAKYLKRMEAEGHIIGNHTYDHQLLSRGYYTNHPSRIVSEMLSTHNLIAPYLNLQKHFYFRAPYGGWTSRVAAIANSNSTLRDYIGPIFWTIGGDLIWGSGGSLHSAADWACWGKHLSVSRCEQGYLTETLRHDGGVVLMHDIHSKTAQMLHSYLRDVTARGFKFVTLDDLPALDAAAPAVASNRARRVR